MTQLPYFSEINRPPGYASIPLCARHTLLTPTESHHLRAIGWFFLPAV